MAEQTSKTGLSPLIDILFMPLAFYVLTQWDKQDTPQEHVGIIIIFVLVLVEYHSITQSFPKYNFYFFLGDFYSFVLYFFALKILSANHCIFFAENKCTELGYNPLFWFLISAIWFGYAAWDHFYYRQATDPILKGRLKEWRNKMIRWGLATIAGTVILLFLLENTSFSGRELWLGGCQTALFLFLCLVIKEWIKDVAGELGKSEL